VTIGGSLKIGYYYEVPYFYILDIKGNNSIVSLNGLDNLTSISELRILGNPNLSVCNEPFICNYLSNSNEAIIDENAPGCNTATEILDACLTPISKPFDETAIILYPNPTKNMLYVVDSERPIERLSIFDMNGKTIYLSEDSANSVDVSDIAQGIYMVKVVVDEGAVYRKIIIER